MPLTWADLMRALKKDGLIAQVVQLHRSRLEWAAVEVAIILRTADGRYTYRRVSCPGNDVNNAAPGAWFHPDPEVLARDGHPSAPRRVEDHNYDTLDQALEAAQAQDPAADPDKWQSGATFLGDAETTGTLERLAGQLRPEAARVGPWGPVAGGVGGLAIFAAVMWVGISRGIDISVSVGQTPWGVLDDLVHSRVQRTPLGGVLLLVGAVAAGTLVAAFTVQYLKHRNLARERDR